MTDPETVDLVQTNPARFAEVERQATFHLAYLFNDNRPSLAVEVLIFTVAMFFLRIKPVAGTTKLEAFDLFMAAARKTLEGNMEQVS